MTYPPQGKFVPPRTATYVVAASNAPAHVKAQADYVCDGVADNVEIQAAIDANPKTLVITPGTYYNSGVFTRVGYSLDILAYGAVFQPTANNQTQFAFRSGLGYDAPGTRLIGAKFLNPSSYTACTAIDIRNSIHTHLEEVFIEGYNYGIWLINDAAGGFSEANIFRNIRLYNNFRGMLFQVSAPGENSFGECSFENILMLVYNGQVGLNVLTGATLYRSYFKNVTFWVPSTGDGAICVALNGDLRDVELDLALESQVVAPASLTGIWVQANALFGPSSAYSKMGHFRWNFQGNWTTRIYAEAPYRTENSGSSTGTGAQQTVAHGLAFAPTRQQIALIAGSATALPFHSAAPDTTNIYVTAASGQPWYWATVGQ